MRVPFFLISSSLPDIDAVFSGFAATFDFSPAAMEHARNAVTSQRKASANAHFYSVGGQVHISTLFRRFLCIYWHYRQNSPLFVGPFEVTRLLWPSKTIICSTA
jgi:hypothetical protein